MSLQGSKGAWFRKGFENILKKTVNMTTDTIQASLIDLSLWTTHAFPITDVSDDGSGQCKVTCGTHGLSANDYVHVTGLANGGTEANGNWFVTPVSGSTTEVYLNSSPVPSSYTGGSEEYLIKMDVPETFGDIDSGAIVSTATMSSVTCDLGVIDASNTGFGAVAIGPAAQAILVHQATSSGKVLFLITGGAGLPITPDGGTITVTWPGGPTYIGRL